MNIGISFLYFRTIFISLPFLYSILYAPFGFEDLDTGFIAGLSWQFIKGALPYTEIIYIRPPTSYIFHSLPLLISENFGFFLDRCLMYYQIAIYSYLTILLLARDFKFADNRLYIYFLSILSFILSVHTFPAMAWHTVDGIFFSVIGIYIILTFDRLNIIFIGTFFLIIGSLAKQPFYIIPVLVLTYIFIQKNSKKFWIIFLNILIISSIFILYFYINGLLADFINLTTGQTNLSDLINSGFLHYFKSLKYILHVFIPPLIVTMIFSKLNLNIMNFNKFFFFLIIWILIFSTYVYIETNTFIGPVYSFPEVLFIISILLVFYKIYRRDNIVKYSLLLLFLSVSWVSSISWGYNTPVLFLAPMIFLFGMHLYESLNIKNYQIYAFLIIIFASIAFYIGYQNPYNLEYASKKSDLIYKMDEVFPKLKYIYGDKETYIKYNELKFLIAKHGENFAVLPDATLIHYLSNTKNPIGIDWCMNAELNNEDKKIIRLLESKKVIVFLKKKQFSNDKKFGSKISVYIKDRWEKIDQGLFFDVYKVREDG